VDLRGFPLVIADKLIIALNFLLSLHQYYLLVIYHSFHAPWMSRRLPYYVFPVLFPSIYFWRESSVTHVQTRHCFPPRVENLYVIIVFPRISTHLPEFEA